jgi:hypothetical protein
VARPTLSPAGKVAVAAAAIAGAALIARALGARPGWSDISGLESPPATRPGTAPQTVAEDAAASNGSEPTRDQLYAEAKRRGIPGRSTMNKAQLQAALEKGDSP